MTASQFEAFQQAIQADQSLQEKLNAAATALNAADAVHAVVTIAKDAGFDLSEEEVSSWIQEADAEISEEELAWVSGGVTDEEKIGRDGYGKKTERTEQSTGSSWTGPGYKTNVRFGLGSDKSSRI